MALISLTFTPDSNYSGTYTLKIRRQPGNTVAYTKVYNPPYSVDISESITLTGLNEYTVKITANDCNKVVYDETVTPETYCGSPRSIKVTSVTDTTAHVSWNIPSNGTPSNGYHYRLYLDETLQEEGDISSGHVLDLTGLTPSLTYTIYIYAMCGINILGTPISTTFLTLD